MDLPLDAHNLVVFAAKAYTNQCFDTQEFLDDLKRLKYVKRLLRQYLDSGDLKTRLILNHFIAFYNVFETESATRMVFLKLDGFYPQIVPFLDLAGFLPDVVSGVGIENKQIVTSLIEQDLIIKKAIDEL